MRRLLILCALPWLLAADDHWVKFTGGPYEVLTEAGARAGRETLVRFEEFRHALGQIVGENDLQTPLPVRIFVFKNAKGWTAPAPIAEGRDRYAIVLGEKANVSPAIYAELTRLFLKSNTAQMPLAFEHGLVQFFSTIEVNGIRITAGAPPGPGGTPPDLDWARIHLLMTDPEYFGKIRVLLYNLRKGVAEDPAYRNAFGKSASEVEAQVKRHFAAGNFQTTSLSSRPMAEGDFPERPISETDVRLARADLLAGTQSAAEYEYLLKAHAKVPEAEEGLGLLALRDHRNSQALRHFADAIQAGSSSARCYIEYARLEPDGEKAIQALLHAAGINPKLDEPFAMMAQRDTDPQKRLAHRKAAAERNPRNASYWKALAEAYVADHNYGAAAAAWKSGEQAATDPAQREQMRLARMTMEQQRLDYEEAEKRREAEEKAREIERLKTEARAELHAAEAKFSDGSAKPDKNAVPWWEGPKPSGRLQGNLKQVDCLGKQARLVVEDSEHKIVKLLMVDPGAVIFIGDGQAKLGCGAQKARHVIIEYFPKPNTRLATAGEVATIEFQ